MDRSESMVERCARAIEAERWRIAMEQVRGVKIDSLEGSRRTARAAIEAMKKPTPEMLAYFGPGWDIEETWPAMIDAALK